MCSTAKEMASSSLLCAKKAFQSRYIRICSNKPYNLYISNHINCNLEPSMSPDTRLNSEVNACWWRVWSLLCFLNKHKPSMETKGHWKCTFSASKFCSKSTHYLTTSQDFCLPHDTKAFLQNPDSLLQSLEFLDYGTYTKIPHTTWVSFFCSQDIHYPTRVCLTITQINLFAFFTKPYHFKFFLQIQNGSKLKYQLHSGEWAGFMQAFHDSKQEGTLNRSKS